MKAAFKRAGVKLDARGGALRSDVPVVLVRHEEVLTNDEAVVALAQYAAAAAERNDRTALFQRDTELVRVHRLEGGEVRDGITRAAGSARIAPLPLATLREMLTRAASFRKITASEENKPTSPPTWCVQAVAARGHWDGIPRLSGIVTFPTLRTDGSVLQKPGYDAASGLMYVPTGNVDPVPESPTREDAARAVAELLAVLEDFPFAQDIDGAQLAHHAALVAALLTPLARPAFRETVAPLFVIEASVRGSGKSLLADVIGTIVAGTGIARMKFPGADDPSGEFRKLVTSVVLSGDRLCLLDNVTGLLGGSTLDMMLTGGSWTDRLLGTMSMMTGPLNTVWYATSNNASLGGDTARRVLPIRLEPHHERPEQRSDFKIPDIKGHVLEARPRLLAAALTILRAYIVAGCPKQKFTPWGSYEDFDRLVRAAVIWAGLPDPCLTRAGLTVSNTAEDEGIRDLIHGLHALIRVHPMANSRSVKSVLASEITKALNSVTDPGTDDPYSTIRNGLDALRPRGGKGTHSAQEIGLLLRHYRGRWVDGLQISIGPAIHNTQTWTVVSRTEGR